MTFQLPNTNFTKEKFDTDRITARYIWKATRRRLHEYDSYRARNGLGDTAAQATAPVLRPRPSRMADWPGNHNRPIPDDVHEEEISTAPLLHRSRKRQSLVDPEKDAIDKTRISHNYFFTFLDQAKNYQCLKEELEK